jgi:aspartate kinase
MALIVQKYGGTSVGSPERIKNVARRVASWQARGHRVVVVVSAMSGETNRLIALAKECRPNPDPRELDVIAVDRRAGDHRPAVDGADGHRRQGAQLYRRPGAVLTDSAFTKARIVSIDEGNIRRDLETARGGGGGLPGRGRGTAASPRWAAAVPTPRRWPSPRR